MPSNSSPKNPWNHVCFMRFPGVLVSHKSLLPWISWIRSSLLQSVISTLLWNSQWFVGGSKHAVRLNSFPLSHGVQCMFLFQDVCYYACEQGLHDACAFSFHKMMNHFYWLANWPHYGWTLSRSSHPLHSLHVRIS